MTTTTRIGLLAAATLTGLLAAGAGIGPLMGGIAPAGAATSTDGVSLNQSVAYRVAGADRYATAIGISRQWYPSPGVAHPVTVYLASGATYPDALSATPVAALTGSPLLLTPPAALRADVAAEINRLGATRVVIVGGSGAVSDAVATALVNSGKQVARIAGRDRYDTSRQVVLHGLAIGAFRADTGNVFIATGRDFPDALAAGAVAGLASVAGPVILEDGTADTLSPTGAALLGTFADATINVIGGPGVVSDAPFAAIPAANKQRLAGADRYATSQAVVDAFRTAPTASIAGMFATGRDFPDALAGAAWAGATDATLWVVPPACVPAGVAVSANALELTSFALLGGSGALSAGLDSLAMCLPLGTPRPVPTLAPSATGSPSPSPTPSATPPFGPTASPSPSAGPTASPSPSPPASATA